MPEDSSIPSRRACDRCHNIKERCQWPPDSDICQRCLRLGHDCQTLRPIQKLGRKPRSRPLRTVPLYGPAQQSGVANEVSPPEGTSSTDRSESSFASPPDSYHQQQSEDLSKIFQDLPGFDDAERELVTVCFAKSDAVGQFTLGPTFHRRHQIDLCFRLRSAVPELKDAFVCCAVIMARHQKLHVSQAAIDLCARKAAVGVASLRLIQVKRREDVTICLVLGMVITTYSFVANGEAQAICACALNFIRPWYRSSNVLFETDEYSYLICLMYTEMIECILKSELPTLRYGEFGKYATWVDRYMGLSPAMLSFFYDICALSSSLRATRDVDNEGILHRINEIEANIRHWKPLTPADFPERFTHVEVMQVMTQVKSLRQASLLLLHRMRFPYGTQDEKGLALSDSILLEGSLALQHIPRAPMGMDIAFVIACFEPREDWHQSETLASVAECLKFSDAYQERIRIMLQAIWRVKATRKDLYWFDFPTYVESVQ